MLKEFEASALLIATTDCTSDMLKLWAVSTALRLAAVAEILMIGGLRVVMGLMVCQV
jgi:hypothetical protein